MSAQSTDVAAPVAKAGTAIAVSSFAGVSAADWAAWLAATYTSFLMVEWLWKKLIKPLLVRHGWMAPPKRRKTDRADDDAQ